MQCKAKRDWCPCSVCWTKAQLRSDPSDWAAQLCLKSGKMTEPTEPKKSRNNLKYIRSAAICHCWYLQEGCLRGGNTSRAASQSTSATPRQWFSGEGVQNEANFQGAFQHRLCSGREAQSARDTQSSLGRSADPYVGQGGESPPSSSSSRPAVWDTNSRINTPWALPQGEILLWEGGEQFCRVSMGVVPSQHPFPRQGSTWGQQQHFLWFRIIKKKGSIP